MTTEARKRFEEAKATIAREVRAEQMRLGTSSNTWWRTHDYSMEHDAVETGEATAVCTKERAEALAPKWQALALSLAELGGYFEMRAFEGAWHLHLSITLRTPAVASVRAAA